MSRTRVATVSEARWAAYKILSRVEKEKAFTSILLPLYEADLKISDRALCHEITLGVIRNRLFLDRVIEHFAEKKLAKLDLPVLLALRIAFYQTRFMSRIPAHAAINESVELVKKERLASAAGFVNAILRRGTQEPEFDPAKDLTDEFERLSILTSHPRWLIEKWSAEFGFEETVKLAETNNKIPQPAFRVNRADKESVLRELSAGGVEFSSSKLVPGCLIVTKANKLLYEFAEQGRIVLQDEASQMVAHLAKLKEGENFLDVCAAPGNKTAQIVSEARESIALSENGCYAAGDLYPRRLEILRSTLEKAQIENVKIFQYDAARKLPFEREFFDCILVDAPCSGTGTLRHNPEIRWSLAPEDFSELAKKQKAILTNSARLLKKGGRMIYSTCSLEIEENETVVESFLAENTDFEVADVNAANELLTDKKFLRTFPQRDNTDGFFAAVLKKF